MFIKRDVDGAIIAISQQASIEFVEQIAEDNHELQEFLDKIQPQNDVSNSLKDSDADFIRVLDDLINLLTEKRIIQFTDLPHPAQQKLLARVSLRQSVNNLNLLSEDVDNETIHL